jgi:hypothetical protein
MALIIHLRVNGIHYTTLFASVEISENQWFNGVF